MMQEQGNPAQDPAGVVPAAAVGAGPTHRRNRLNSRKRQEDVLRVS